jgi:hypothetical protein
MVRVDRSFLLMIVVVLMVSAVSIPVSAITEQEVKDFFLNTYNPQIESLGKIPGFTSLFGGQIMHIIIKDKPGGNIQFELNATTKPDGFIANIENGAPEKPTLKLTTDSETIDSIKTSADPKQKIIDSIGSKIIIEGVDIIGGIKVTFMNVGLFFAKLFGLV